MHRAEIDDSGRWWTIPSERSWNNQAHRVYLTDLAQKLIGNVAGYVFASPRDPERSYDGKTLTHDIKANLPHTPDSKVVDRLKIAHFVPHDLRRTAANIMAEAGVTGDIIDKVQNHISKQKAGVGHIYDRNSYDKEKQIALEKLERKLNSIITEVKVKK
jgi:integrase